MKNIKTILIWVGIVIELASPVLMARSVGSESSPVIGIVFLSIGAITMVIGVMQNVKQTPAEAKQLESWTIVSGRIGRGRLYHLPYTRRAVKILPDLWKKRFKMIGIYLWRFWVSGVKRIPSFGGAGINPGRGCDDNGTEPADYGRR